METTIVEQNNAVTKESILSTLGPSWNGTAVNGTPYTQWDSTEGFFTLFHEKKDEVKALGFSLYKHEAMGWVVTLFGVQEGDYDSRESYKNSFMQEEEECQECDGSGWDDHNNDKCDCCGGSGMWVI